MKNKITLLFCHSFLFVLFFGQELSAQAVTYCNTDPDDLTKICVTDFNGGKMAPGDQLQVDVYFRIGCATGTASIAMNGTATWGSFPSGITSPASGTGGTGIITINYPATPHISTLVTVNGSVPLGSAISFFARPFSTTQNGSFGTCNGVNLTFITPVQSPLIQNGNIGLPGKSITVIKDAQPDVAADFGFTTTDGTATLRDAVSSPIAVNDISFNSDGTLLVSTAAGAVYKMLDKASAYLQPVTSGVVLSRIDGSPGAAATWSGVASNGTKYSTDGGLTYTVASANGTNVDTASESGAKHFMVASNGVLWYYDDTTYYSKGFSNAALATDIDYANGKLLIIKGGVVYLASSNALTTSANVTGLASTALSTTSNNSDVAVGITGAFNTVYAINNTSVLNYTGNGTTTTWTTLPAPPSAPVAITVDPSGRPWIVMTNGNLAVYTGTSWKTLYVLAAGNATPFVNYYYASASPFTITETSISGGYRVDSIVHEGDGTSAPNVSTSTDVVTLVDGDHAFETFINKICAAGSLAPVVK